MTLEEAKALAEQGDVDAMMALASYYSEEGDAEEAFRYYELAAECGNFMAILKVTEVANMSANLQMTMLEKAGICAPEFEEDLKKAYDWTTKLVDSAKTLDDPSKVATNVHDIMMEALSRLAAMYNVRKNYKDLASLTKGIDDPYAQVVYGFALFQLSENEREFKEGFNLLKNLENSACWKDDFQKNLPERGLLVIMAVSLSCLYRTVDNDIDSAYRVLEKALGYLTDDSAKEDIENEMSTHYRKKLFGGYAYIE